MDMRHKARQLAWSYKIDQLSIIRTVAEWFMSSLCKKNAMTVYIEPMATNERSREEEPSLEIAGIKTAGHHLRRNSFRLYCMRLVMLMVLPVQMTEPIVLHVFFSTSSLINGMVRNMASAFGTSTCGTMSKSQNLELFAAIRYW